MENFSEYIKNKEEKDFDEQSINEEIALILLGIPTITALSAWGGSLLIAGFSKLFSNAIRRISKAWHQIKDAFKGFSKPELIDAYKSTVKDPKVINQVQKSERNSRRFESELKDVYAAIDSKDWQGAKEEFKALDKTLKSNPDVVKTLVTEITKEMKEPPIYVTSPGNKTYQAIKKSLGIRIARAAAEATKLIIQKNMPKNNMEE